MRWERDQRWTEVPLPSLLFLLSWKVVRLEAAEPIPGSRKAAKEIGKM